MSVALLGVALEWYDFILYGFFAAVIGRVFFPAGPDRALLLSVATFGVGFLMRPVGGVLLGLYADRAGRRPALALGMGLMTLGTFTIGVAPGYRSIGIAAPALVVVARLLQGFASAGIFASSSAFLIEHAPARFRGLYGSLQQAGQFLAALAATSVGAVVTALLGEAEVEAWGWRVPFLCGLLVGPAALWLHRSGAETEAFLVVEETGRHAALQDLVAERRLVQAGFGVTVFATVAAYVLVVFMPSWIERMLHQPMLVALGAGALGATVLVLLCPVAGAASDHMARRWIIPALSAVLLLLFSYPLLHWMAARPSAASLWGGVAALCVPLAGFTGPLPALMSENLPVHVRGTGLSLAYNLSVTLFGGFAPFIVASLIGATGDPAAGAAYVAIAALISLPCLPALSARRPPPQGPSLPPPGPL